MDPRRRWRAWARKNNYPHVNGAVVWEGPSEIDGSPIMLILTGLGRSSSNEKTGAQVQSWILRRDVTPYHAIEDGTDKAICGDCKHRPTLVKLAKDRGEYVARCYVQVNKAPQTVYQAWQRGNYPRVKPSRIPHGYNLRLGSYGDPCAVPARVWASLLKGALSHTGYTHQWKEPKVAADPRWRQWLMASVDNLTETGEAWSKGWRTFRVAAPGMTPIKTERRCPASKEAGKILTCVACRACDGLGRGAKRPSITIQEHGAGARRSA